MSEGSSSLIGMIKDMWLCDRPMKPKPPIAPPAQRPQLRNSDHSGFERLRPSSDAVTKSQMDRMCSPPKKEEPENCRNCAAPHDGVECEYCGTVYKKMIHLPLDHPEPPASVFVF